MAEQIRSQLRDAGACCMRHYTTVFIGNIALTLWHETGWQGDRWTQGARLGTHRWFPPVSCHASAEQQRNEGDIALTQRPL